jgi:aminoglycoside phosphotransferase (APT) family kinase protein
LEEAESSMQWPWANVQHSGAVCRALARLHDSRTIARDAFTWDYDAELEHSARSTLEVAEDARNPAGIRCWERLGDLRRVVAALPRIRRRLLSGATTLIHGDMHPGNVILQGNADPQVLLIDWARARVGSPLEDVASWLHSLGCWEPEARRRHDTLMRIYLDARAAPQRFAADVRLDYWLASASNGLSGAIRYHMARLSGRELSDASRYDSTRAMAAWQRVIKRTAGLLSTNLDHRT